MSPFSKKNSITGYCVCSLFHAMYTACCCWFIAIRGRMSSGVRYFRTPNRSLIQLSTISARREIIYDRLQKPNRHITFTSLLRGMDAGDRSVNLDRNRHCRWQKTAEEENKCSALCRLHFYCLEELLTERFAVLGDKFYCLYQSHRQCSTV
jgi:hypothetical protein